MRDHITGARNPHQKRGEVLVSCLQAAQVRSAVSTTPRKRAGCLASRRTEAYLHLSFLFKMPSYLSFFVAKHKVLVAKVQHPPVQGALVQNKPWAQVEPGISIFFLHYSAGTVLRCNRCYMHPSTVNATLSCVTIPPSSRHGLLLTPKGKSCGAGKEQGSPLGSWDLANEEKSVGNK